MKPYWVEQTEHSCTLVSDWITPKRHAWISPTFLHEGMFYRATIVSTREEQKFLTLQQAKDWAQAVVLLTH